MRDFSAAQASLPNMTMDNGSSRVQINTLKAPLCKTKQSGRPCGAGGPGHNYESFGINRIWHDGGHNGLAAWAAAGKRENGRSMIC